MSLLGLPTPPKWMNSAACAQIGVGMAETWFPTKGGANTVAKEVCSWCPVRKACLNYALKHDESGVWGGTSEHERLVMTGRRAS